MQFAPPAPPITLIPGPPHSHDVNSLRRALTRTTRVDHMPIRSVQHLPSHSWQGGQIEVLAGWGIPGHVGVGLERIERLDVGLGQFEGIEFDILL